MGYMQKLRNKACQKTEDITYLKKNDKTVARYMQVFDFETLVPCSEERKTCSFDKNCG